ncbi:MAG: rhodanese-like domain-containing protein [Sphingomonadales bacterium]|jgi:rhodanese-related sulfurtransferase
MLMQLSPSDAARHLAAGHATLIDVREPPEFAARHIPGSLSRPLSLPDDTALPGPPDSDIIFTCLSGRRTAANHDRLAALLGSRRGFILAGGVDAWGLAGQPLSHPHAG